MSAALAERLGRMRQQGSLTLRQPALLRALIGATQDTMLGPFVTPQTFELAKADTNAFGSGEREYEDGERFFNHFNGLLTHEMVKGADVFDLGCGYGGRTVYYAELGARHVTGIEISEKVIERCKGFAAQRGVDNVTFEVEFAENLPYDDESFDLLLCFDVMEHVQDTVRAFREIARVLRPGGHAWLVFPTYFGARASHLDYLTQIPALHRVFDLPTVIDVVNEFLAAKPEVGVAQQPAPVVGPLGRRALPSVNGLSRREMQTLVQRTGLIEHLVDWKPLAAPTAPYGIGPVMAGMQALGRLGWPPDLLIGHLRLHLSKPA